MSRIDRRRALTLGASFGLLPALASAPGTALARKSAQKLTIPVRLSANENPYGPSPLARNAMAGATDEACRYGVRAAMDLTERLQAHEGVGKGQILLGSGSGELLHLLAAVYCERRDVVCAWPTFAQLMSYAEKVGAEIKRLPLDAALRHDLPALAAATSPNTGLLYICNPNNPSGTVIAGATLREFCREQSQRTLVVVDEAYLDLIEAGATESMVDLVREGANVVVLRTFSKIHGLAGLRVGYAVASAEVNARLRRLQMSSIANVSLAAATASLSDTQFLAATRRDLLADRVRLTTLCRELNLPFAEPHGNFVFIDVGMPAAEFAKKMQAQGIEVGRTFEPLKNWSRISLGTRPQMDYLLETLRSIMRA
jgi:histidinol-phosphate aminotransferase